MAYVVVILIPVYYIYNYIESKWYLFQVLKMMMLDQRMPLYKNVGIKKVSAR